MIDEQTEMATELHIVGEVRPTAIIDVVFIHGIGGDPNKTWTGRATDKDAFWPLWVGAAIPEAQIWTAHYPAQLSNWFGPSFPLAQASITLLDRMAQRIGDRPIVLVCHSLGGLLAKQMLRASYDLPAREHFRRFGENVVGIVFLGTPHQGAFLASIARHLFRTLGIVAKLSGFTDTTAELAKENTYLENLGDWFRSMVAERQLQVRVYAENLPTKGVMVVDNHSANPGLVNVQSIPMALNHFELAGPRQRGDQISDGVINFVRELASRKIMPMTTARPARIIEGGSSRAGQKPPILQDSFKSLCQAIWPLMEDNTRIFEDFGPNSGAAKPGENDRIVREDQSLWHRQRLKIRDNNRLIAEHLRANMRCIPDVQTLIFRKWLSHIEAFSQHLSDEDVDYRHHQFPREVIGIVKRQL